MTPTNGHSGAAPPFLPATDLADRKRAVRTQAKQRRAEAHARHATIAPFAVRDAFLATIPLPVRGVVSGYLPFGEELDPRPLMVHLHTAGLACCVPVILGKGRPLAFREWSPSAILRVGAHGIPIPGADAAEVTPTLLIVPLLAFDRQGRRMGYGAGYYDRTLAALRRTSPVTAVGVAYADQEMREVPTDEHDEPLDWIITERDVLAISLTEYR